MMVTKKSIVWVNGKPMPSVCRMLKLSRKPKAIARPAVLTPEQLAEFHAKYNVKAPQRPPRTLLSEETLKLLRERSRAMKEAYKKSLKKSA
jgi:hypothetical protein